jgi:hypothetical protein
LSHCDAVVSSTSREAERLSRLALLQVVDTDAEPFFDALAAAAQAIAGNGGRPISACPMPAKPHANSRSAPTPSRTMR